MLKSTSELLASVSILTPRDGWSVRTNEQQFTPEYLRERIYYSGDDGVLYWRCRYDDHEWSKRFAGRLATEDVFAPSGQVMLRLDGLLLVAARAAYAIVTGGWPEQELTHHNRLQSDCRWCNIDPAQAPAPRLRPVGRSGFLGVTEKGGRYEASLRVAGRRRSYGSYATAEEAAHAYDAAAVEHQGAAARTNAGLGLL